jgi:hypothetical protein
VRRRKARLNGAGSSGRGRGGAQAVALSASARRRRSEPWESPARAATARSSGIGVAQELDEEATGDGFGGFLGMASRGCSSTRPVHEVVGRTAARMELEDGRLRC